MHLLMTRCFKEVTTILLWTPPLGVEILVHLQTETMHLLMTRCFKEVTTILLWTPPMGVEIHPTNLNKYYLHNIFFIFIPLCSRTTAIKFSPPDIKDTTFHTDLAK